jgi:hypothetical protein
MRGPKLKVRWSGILFFKKKKPTFFFCPLFSLFSPTIKLFFLISLFHFVLIGDLA